MKVRDLSGRLGPVLVNKLERFGGRACPGPVDKCEELGVGLHGPGPANKSEGFWAYGPRAGGPTLFGRPSNNGLKIKGLP